MLVDSSEMSEGRDPAAIAEPARSYRELSVPIVAAVALVVHITWLIGNELLNPQSLVLYRTPHLRSAVHQQLPFAAEAVVALVFIGWLRWWRPVGLRPAHPTKITPSFAIPILVYLVLFLAGVAALAAVDAMTIGLLITMTAGYGVSAFTEEVVFRGFLLHGLTARLGLPVAVTVSSVLFASIHFLPYRGIEAVDFILLFGFGVLMCRIRMTTGSVWYPYVTHFSANLSWTVWFWLWEIDRSEPIAWLAWASPSLAGLLIFASMLLAGAIEYARRDAIRRGAVVAPDASSSLETNYRAFGVLLAAGVALVLLAGTATRNLVEVSPARLAVIAFGVVVLGLGSLMTFNALLMRRHQRRTSIAMTSDAPVEVDPAPLPADVAARVDELEHLGFALIASGRRSDMGNPYALLLHRDGTIVAEVLVRDAAGEMPQIWLSSMLHPGRGSLETATDGRGYRLWAAQLMQAFPNAGAAELVGHHRDGLRFLGTRGITAEAVSSEELPSILTWARQEYGYAIARASSRRFRAEVLLARTHRFLGTLEDDPTIGEHLARYWTAIQEQREADPSRAG